MRSAPVKHRWAGLLQAAVGITLLAVLASWIDFGQAREILGRVGLTLVAILLAMGLVDRCLMAFKWNGLLRAQGVSVSFLVCLRAYLVAGFVGSFLPSSVGGDVYRVYRIQKATRHAATVATSVVLERVIGFSVISCLAVVGLLYRWLAGGMVSDVLTGVVGLALILIMAAAVIAAIGVALYRRGWAPERLRKGRLGGIARETGQALSRFRDRPRALVGFVLLTLIEQFLWMTMVFVGARGLGFPTSLVDTFSLLPPVMILQRLPISVNALGVMEGGYVLFFAIVGLSTTESFSLALLMRLVIMTIDLASGLILVNEGLQASRNDRARAGQA